MGPGHEIHQAIVTQNEKSIFGGEHMITGRDGIRHSVGHLNGESLEGRGL